MRMTDCTPAAAENRTAAPPSGVSESHFTSSCAERTHRATRPPPLSQLCQITERTQFGVPFCLDFPANSGRAQRMP